MHHVLSVWDFTSNKLQVIPLSTFDGCSKITKLDLSDNSLTGVEDIWLPSNFTTLDLSRNKMKYVDDNFCEHAPGVKHLNISNNILETISRYNFYECDLISLDISRNQLTRIQATCSSV